MDGTSRRPNLVGIIAGSKPVELVLTLVVYAVYATVVGVSLIPSSFLMLTAMPALLEPVLAGPAITGTSLASVGFLPTLRAATLVALTLAAALYLYLFWGTVVQAALIRVLSFGIGPGRYAAVSFTTLRWLIFSGIYTVSMKTILPLVPVSFVTNLFFRIIGCRMGQNVKINTNVLNDAYLLTIGDNVIIGGQTDISCHLFEHNHLVLRPITIGSDTLIGAHSYISPGVTIGSRCIIGLHSYIRAGRVIP